MAGPRKPRLLRQVRAELTSHVGGQPSATQRAMIAQAAMLQLHIAAMDRKFIAAGGGLSEFDGKRYLAWCGVVSRLLRLLGLRAAAEVPRSLADHLAAAPVQREPLPGKPAQVEPLPP